LKDQVTTAKFANQQARENGLADTLATQLEIQQRQMAIFEESKQLGLALLMYTVKNEGQFPSNFDQAASFLPDAFKKQTNVTTDDFAIVYQGTVNSVTNPGETVIIRQKEAVRNPLEGNWVKTYVFADGHSELHTTADGNFGPWESQHVQHP
jgi:hypothetical protein